MIVRIVPIVPVVSKNVQAIGTIIWKHFPDDRRRSQTTRTIGTITIVRIELCSIRTIAHDRGDREKSEAIKWKHSQTIGTIGTIGTIEVYPRKHHSRHHSVVGPRNFADDRELPLLGRSRRSFGNQRSPQSSRSSQSSQKFFETTGTIETIRTIIWKPGFKVKRTVSLDLFNHKLFTSEEKQSLAANENGKHST